MGMYNAIFDDELLNPLGIYKERLSQSALVAEMATVTPDEAQGVRDWLDRAGMTFHAGTEEATELTDAQLLSQFRMYIAALRIADDFGLDAVGIQYQQGLKDTVPASDLAEGLLNDVERPPVHSRDGARELYAGLALPHFNEVDEGVAVDSLVTNRIWTAMGLDPATTLHDIRWGAPFAGDFVWVMVISGSVPAAHTGGFDLPYSLRQPPMFSPPGGGTLCRGGGGLLGGSGGTGSLRGHGRWRLWRALAALGPGGSRKNGRFFRLPPLFFGGMPTGSAERIGWKMLASMAKV